MWGNHDDNDEKEDDDDNEANLLDNEGADQDDVVRDLLNRIMKMVMVVMVVMIWMLVGTTSRIIKEIAMSLQKIWKRPRGNPKKKKKKRSREATMMMMMMAMRSKAKHGHCYSHCQARTEKLEKGETQTRKRSWARPNDGPTADRDIDVTLNLNPTGTAKPQDDGRDEFLDPCSSRHTSSTSSTMAAAEPNGTSIEALFRPSTRFRDSHRHVRLPEGCTEVELLPHLTMLDILATGVTWEDFHRFARDKMVWMTPDVFVCSPILPMYGDPVVLSLGVNNGYISLRVHVTSDTADTVATATCDFLVRLLATCEERDLYIDGRYNSVSPPLSGASFSDYKL
jgi:hypothetical protein